MFRFKPDSDQLYVHARLASEANSDFDMNQPVINLIAPGTFLLFTQHARAGERPFEEPRQFCSRPVPTYVESLNAQDIIYHTHNTKTIKLEYLSYR